MKDETLWVCVCVWWCVAGRLFTGGVHGFRLADMAEYGGRIARASVLSQGSKTLLLHTVQRAQVSQDPWPFARKGDQRKSASTLPQTDMEPDRWFFDPVPISGVPKRGVTVHESNRGCEPRNRKLCPRLPRAMVVRHRAYIPNTPYCMAYLPTLTPETTTM